MPRYARPHSVEEAVGLLDGGRWRILAGGTDFYPAQGSRPLKDDVLDVTALPGLGGIGEDDTHFSIGALATWSDLLRSDLPPAFDALKLAAREVGSIQIQNAATIAGNLCNASPAADGVPPLLVLDAEVELASASGRRRLPLGDFILGNRRTARRPNELMTAIRIPRSSTAGMSHFVKLGARRYLVISIAMVAARVELDGEGRIVQAALAVGACSEVACRLRGLEATIRGLAPADALRAIEAAEFAELSPIDDVRATAAYRRAAAREITARAVDSAVAAAHARPEATRAVA